MSETPRKCLSCRHIRRYAEDFDGRHFSFECGKRPAMANLYSFPFKNGCKDYEPEAR